MNARGRPLRLSSFTVAGDRVIVVDEIAPLAIEIDIERGAVHAVHTWVVPPFSGQPVANDVEIVDDVIVVASPAAGGVVFIDRSTEAVTTVALDAAIGRLIVDGSSVWAIADPDWSVEPLDDHLGRRPVVWVEPTEAELEAHRAELRAWNLPDADDEPDFDWRDAPDNGSDIIRPPTPVWRIRAGVAARIDVGGQVGAFVARNDLVLAVCTLPTDPVVKTIEPGGSLSYRYPASLVLGTPESGFERVGDVPELGASLFAAGDRVWLLELDRTDDDFETLRSFDPATRSFSAPSRLDAEQPVAVVSDQVVDLPRARRGGSPTLRLVPIAGGDATTFPIPEVDAGWSREPVIAGSRIWFRTEADDMIVGVDTETGAVREVALAIDCAPYLAPAPRDASAQSSITLPVMLDSWELECCQPDAVVGEPWTAFLVLGAAEPGWLEYATDPVPDSVRDFGVVEFVGTVLRPAPRAEHAGLVATGPVRVAVVDVRGDQQRFRGVLQHEVHGQVEGVLSTENECTGIVRRIQGIAFRREEKLWDGEPASVPVAQEPPVDLESTATRGYDTYALTIEFAPGAAS